MLSLSLLLPSRELGWAFREIFTGYKPGLDSGLFCLTIIWLLFLLFLKVVPCLCWLGNISAILVQDIIAFLMQLWKQYCGNRNLRSSNKTIISRERFRVKTLSAHYLPYQSWWTSECSQITHKLFGVGREARDRIYLSFPAGKVIGLSLCFCPYLPRYCIYANALFVNV